MSTPVILAADGYTHAHHETLLLTSHTVMWFLEGRQMLKHADDLGAVRARLVCSICEAHGGADDCVVAQRSDGDLFVACAHRPQGGLVRMARPLEVQPLLYALGWNLCCSTCGDALRGDNRPQEQTRLTVTCPCTTRQFLLAQA